MARIRQSGFRFVWINTIITGVGVVKYIYLEISLPPYLAPVMLCGISCCFRLECIVSAANNFVTDILNGIQPQAASSCVDSTSVVSANFPSNAIMNYLPSYIQTMVTL